MKFSKDKKPTEPGWYWHMASYYTAPRVAEVSERDGDDALMVSVTGAEGWWKLNANSGDLWGSKIEVPTVEQE